MALLVVPGASVDSSTPTVAAPTPIRLHPKNPRYFEWRGKALALVTSAEHYGAVINRDFDFVRYLDTLAADGMNYTRIFAGTYIELAGAFGIERNTLAPAPGRFLAPWVRSGEPGYPGGGNKFDLDRFDPAYLDRLKSFVGQAGKRGIVVELTLFCATYSDKQWAVHPFNPANNVQKLAVPSWKALHTPDNGPAMAYHEKLVRYLVRELNGFDNVFYELQNEPWGDNHVMRESINPYLHKELEFSNPVAVVTQQGLAWQSAIAGAIADEESRLPHKHLVAQNISNFRLPVRDDDLAPGVSILNFHYAHPDAVTWNAGLGRLIGFDESGFAGTADATYRRQAWEFLWSGGGLFNSLDFSFSVGHEDGRDVQPESPGGGGATLRRQLKVLSDFLNRFDLATLAPDPTFVRQAPGVVARALGVPGKAWGVYVLGRAPTTLVVNLPKGRWQVEWIDVETGQVSKAEEIRHPGAVAKLPSPPFAVDAAVRVVRRN